MDKSNVCIITGAGSGIGRALAQLLALKDFKLVLVGRSAEKIAETSILVSESSAEPPLTFVLDVADKAAVEGMAAEVVDRYGRIDALINNAGHSSSRRRLLDTTPEDIRSVLDSNLVGTIYCTQAVMPVMLRAKRGTVINVASRAGTHPGLLGGMIYCAAKAAVINFTGFLRDEFKNSGLRFSVVIPGEVDTPIIDKRPIPPDAAARETMIPVNDAAEVIASLLLLSNRTNIPEVQIMPSHLRDFSNELKGV